MPVSQKKKTQKDVCFTKTQKKMFVSLKTRLLRLSITCGI